MTDSSRPRPPTMKQVAARAGVDASVVSRVLNHPQRSVSAATRQRVLAAVEELGYRPNLAARALRSSRGLLAAFVLPEFTNPVYSRIVAGANRRAVELGYAIVLGEAPADTATHGLRQLHDYRSRGVDGVLLAAGVLDDDVLRRMAGADLPVVVVNRPLSGLRRWAVVDYRAGSQLAAEHLVGLGHRDLAVVAGPAQFDSGNRRAHDFVAVVEKLAGVRPPVHCADALAVSGGQATARALLSGPAVPTAIFTTTLMLAVGVLLAARAAGLRVPQDLSILAMQDADVAKYTSPALTTVAMPMDELGAAAFDHLMAVIAGEDPEPAVVATAPNLVVRESTAPPRSTR